MAHKFDLSNINPHVVGDASAVIPVTLAWLEQAPNIAAVFTILWFVYRFFREIRKGFVERLKNKSSKKT